MLKSERSDGVIVCSFELTNKLNSINSDAVKKEAGGHFEVPGTRLIMDLGNISFIDSSGFGALLSLMRSARTNSGMLLICNITPGVMKVFRLLQLDKVFEIYDSREECLKSFA